MDKKVIHVEHSGRLANRMFQYMFARSLQIKIDGSIVSGCEIPEFGVMTGIHEFKMEKSINISGGHDYNMEKIAYLINENIFRNIIFSGFGMRVEYYKNVDLFRSMFNFGKSGNCIGFDEKFLVIHIRLEDIANGIHEDYMPIPISFYEKIISELNLSPIFIGQIDNSDYCMRLRDKFPSAKFIKASSVIDDFNIIRSSKNILLSISSFSWLSAYFSFSNNIFVHVQGIFNPVQRPDINLLPVFDKRYNFYWMDPMKWSGSSNDYSYIIFGDAPLRKLKLEEMSFIFSKITV